MHAIEQVVREKTADAAIALWLSPRNIPQAWFRHAEPHHIRSTARRMASRVRIEHPQYREQHGARVIAASGWSRDSTVADAAQWLWVEWGSPRHWLEAAYPAEIVHDYAKAYALDIKKVISRKPIEDKNYSLSDLRRAYDMGFGASSEGWNGEIHPDYVDKENYQAERQESLREFK